MDTDESIATAIQNGQTELFGELINRYEAKLTRYGNRFLGSPDDVTDMVQDVFIKAYTHIQSFKATERFSPWLYRIAHNTFLNEIRRQKRYGFSLFDIDTDSLFPHLPAKETTEDLALDRERVRQIEAILNELPLKEREIILLSYFEDMTYEEMSAVLHLPINTIGVRLYRAKKKLKSLLEKSPPTI